MIQQYNLLFCKMMFILFLSIHLNCLSKNELIFQHNKETENYVNFIKKINEGQKKISEMCDVLDETYGIISGSNKPECNYTIPFVNENEIVVKKIDYQVKKFFQEERIKFCKSQKIECGELTIILKLFELINAAITISLKLVNSEFLWINLDIIQFNEFFELYISSLKNIEILTNTTLSKQKANVILEIEKNRIRSQLSKTWINSIQSDFNIYLFNPITDVLYGTGSILYDFTENGLNIVMPEISYMTKLIILSVLIIILKKI